MAEYIVKESGYPGRLETKIVGELIRCKDCYHYPGEYTDCPMIEWARNGEDFCSKAERKEGETDD